jgi:hypothetical protein
VSEQPSWRKLYEHNHQLEVTANRLRGLLKRLNDIVYSDEGCGCEDCELVREIKKELADDND